MGRMGRDRIVGHPFGAPQECVARKAGHPSLPGQGTHGLQEGVPEWTLSPQIQVHLEPQNGASLEIGSLQVG